LVQPEGVMQVVISAISVQVSGVRCQQLQTIQSFEAYHELDFHSQQLNFIHNPIRGQDAGLFFC